MLIFIVVVTGIIGIVCLVMASIIFFDECETPTKSLIMFGICIVICVLSINYVKHISNETVWEEVQRTNIIALKDNSNIEGRIGGSIFIASGYIRESMYYYYMESTSEGKHMAKIPVADSYIIETDDKKPMIIKKAERHLDERYDFWIGSNNYERYIIYVPTGTVDTTYKVDLQ